MNCEQFKEKILDFLYDEVSEEDRVEVARHLRACSSCNAEANELKLVRTDLAEWKDPATRDFPITLPYPSPFRLLKQWLLPRRWSGRNVMTFAATTAALVLVAFSVLGTEIHISSHGLAFRADLLRRSGVTLVSQLPSQPDTAKPVELPRPASVQGQDYVKAELLREVSRMIQESESRQEQLVKSEEIRLVNQLTSGNRAQLTNLAKTMDDKHKLDLVAIYDNLEQQRLADLQKIRMTFSSLDERTSQQAKQTQQLVDFIQKASYQPK